MLQTDKKRFAKCLLYLSMNYDKTLNDDAYGMWFDLLKDYDIEEVEKAFFKMFKNTDVGQFAPKPSDIIRMIEGSSTETAALAWTKADRAVGVVGIYRDICFDDAIINRVISDMGGWVKFCSCPSNDEWGFVENDFKARYKGYKLRSNLSEYPRQLNGIANSQNSQSGFEKEPVYLFGSQETARHVHNGGLDIPLHQVGVLNAAKDVLIGFEKKDV